MDRPIPALHHVIAVRRNGRSQLLSGDRVNLAARDTPMSNEYPSKRYFNSRIFKLRKATSSPWSCSARGVGAFVAKPGTTRYLLFAKAAR